MHQDRIRDAPVGNQWFETYRQLRPPEIMRTDRIRFSGPVL